jgi:hypothetical protein
VIGNAGITKASESSSCKMVTGYMLTSSKAQKFESRHGVNIRNETASIINYHVEYSHKIDKYFNDTTAKDIQLNAGESYVVDELFTSMIKPAMGNFTTIATTKIYVNGAQINNCENYGVLTVPAL